jgi:hypothetical protein
MEQMDTQIEGIATASQACKRPDPEEAKALIERFALYA